MRTEKGLVLCFVVLLIQLVACERGKMEENAPAPLSGRMGADSMGLDSINVDSLYHDSIWRDSIRRDTIIRDTVVIDSSFVDSLRRLQKSSIPGNSSRLKSIR